MFASGNWLRINLIDGLVIIEAPISKSSIRRIFLKGLSPPFLRDSLPKIDKIRHAKDPI
jgi:hypothetical protein